MTIKKQTCKHGYVLVAVMVAIMIITIALSAVFKYGEIARTKLAGNINQRQAFWSAEAGLTKMLAIAKQSCRPFGENGLPDLGEALTGQLENGEYSVVATSLSEGKFLLTSTGTCGNENYEVSCIASLDPFSKSVLSTINKKDSTWFTAADAIYGPIYMNGMVQLMPYGGDWPDFAGEVRTTENGFRIYGKEELQTAPSGVANEYFPEKVYFNEPELDFLGENSSDYIKDIADEADLTLTGNYTMHLNEDGTITYSKKNNNNKNKNKNKNNDNDNNNDNTTIAVDDVDIIYVTGQLDIDGTLDGELTIGVNNRVNILDDGIRYESAPDDPNVENWDDDDLENLDDYFALVCRQDMVCEGDDPIELHGAYMVTEDGAYPENRNVTLDKVDGEKPKMYLLGSLSEAAFQYTEGSKKQGFGTYWIYDERLLDKILKGFPWRGYSFSDWMAINLNKKEGRDKNAPKGNPKK